MQRAVRVVVGSRSARPALWGVDGLRLGMLSLVITGLTSLIVPVAGRAVTPISQGFLISGAAALGSIVSLQKDSSDNIELTTTANTNNILGVVVQSDSSLLSVTSGQSNQVQVATS